MRLIFVLFTHLDTVIIQAEFLVLRHFLVPLQLSDVPPSTQESQSLLPIAQGPLGGLFQARPLFRPLLFLSLDRYRW